MKNNLRGSIILLITAMIWGFAFVAQSEGMEKIGPFTFQASRMLLAAVVLLPVSLVSYNIKKKKNDAERFMDKKTLIAGMICGVFLFAAATLQQIGILYTTVGHAGFLTALYILIVPLLGLFVGKKVGAHLWVCIALALVGLYLLCMTGEGFSMSIGDILVTLCALVFSFHILAVDKFTKGLDGVRISMIQMLTAGLLSLVCMFIFEEPSVSDILSSWLPIAYAGVLSCGAAYTMQIIGQKYASPTVASIIMSLESVFAVLGGAMILLQIPSVFEAIGCTLMFAATVISQLPEKAKK
ncbi:MAG: DMT family transporter [Clostridia bacterium]|nr:DMT family transporter [Clostridia bacterium]